MPDVTYTPVDHDPFEALSFPPGQTASLAGQGNNSLADYMRAFAGGGLYGVSKLAGASTPGWADRTAQVLQNPDAVAAMGAVTPMGPMSKALAASRLGQAVAPESPSISFYHASPHTFDKFDISKIGTGEGAQVYGHGLYGAQNRDVAESYFDTFKRKRGVAKMYSARANVDPDHFLDWDKPIEEQSQHVQDALKTMDMFEGENALKAYAGQSGQDLHDELAGWHHMGLENDAFDSGKPYSVKAIESEAQKRAAQDLKAAGIPGIKYMDEGSRVSQDEIDKHQGYIDALRADLDRGGFKQIDPATGETQLIPYSQDKINAAQSKIAQHQMVIDMHKANPVTRNYVFFDDKYLNIVKKWALAGLIGAGYKHFSTTEHNGDDPF